jgi:thiol:disulfide interchange protein
MTKIIEGHMTRMDFWTAVTGLRTVALTLLAVGTALPFVAIGHRTVGMAFLSRPIKWPIEVDKFIATLVMDGLAHESVISLLLPAIDDTKTTTLMIDAAL